MQVNWHRYGIDYEEPVPLDNDSNIVRVDETPDYLSQEESNLLRQQLTYTDGFSKEALLHNFTIASLFVHGIDHS